jgi:lipopolysaccharide export LptBFGC system permease protein LptF|tara:strand:+ start:1065 stop:1991 length:927 start_codon:yes stop_codon:yes gene_type:complete
MGDTHTTDVVLENIEKYVESDGDIKEKINTDKRFYDKYWNNTSIRNYYNNYKSDDTIRNISEKEIQNLIKYKQHDGSFRGYANNNTIHTDKIEEILYDDYLNYSNATVEDNLGYYENRSEFLDNVKHRNEHLSDYSKNLKILQEATKMDISTNIQDLEDLHYDNNVNKRRVKLNKFYEKKLKYQTDILKTMSFIFLTLLTICLIYKFGFINNTFFILFTSVGITLALVIFIYKIIDIFFRDNVDYDSYNINNILFSKNYLNTGDGKTKIKGLNDIIELRLQDNVISSKCFPNLGKHFTDSINNIVDES